MKYNFQFDKETGTYIKNKDIPDVPKQDVKVTPTEDTSPPVFEEEKQINAKSSSPNVQQNMVVQMKRVNTPTPIQIVDSNGMAESYLAPINTGVVMFRERQDYDICQIIDENTGKPLAYIGGYALQINFNLAELNTLEKIEQCLQGITKLFRHKIMSQNLKSEKN